jgi:hypothetical protein
LKESEAAVYKVDVNAIGQKVKQEFATKSCGGRRP